MSAAVLTDLARVKVLFQLRAVCAVLGIATPRQHDVNDQQPRDEDAEAFRTVLPARTDQ